MVDESAPATSHLRTVGAAILCTVLIVPGTIVGNLLQTIGLRHFDPKDSWIPFYDVIYEAGTSILSGVIAAVLAMQITIWIVKRFNHDVVVYTAAGVHITFIATLWIILIVVRGGPSEPIALAGQLAGIVFGLAISRQFFDAYGRAR